MTDHETNETPTEAEAREGVYAAIREGEEVGMVRRYVMDPALDAYAEAVRAAERARLAGLVRTLREVMVPMSMRLGGELVDRADVLRLLTEDTAR